MSDETQKEKFAKRLHAARVMQGLSMEQLCSRLPVAISRQSIYKYEHAQMMPDSSSLCGLAKALGVDVNYFFRSSIVAVDNIEFRKKSRMTKTEQEKITACTREALEKYLLIEKENNISETFDLDFSDTMVSTRSQVVTLAQRLRCAWDIGNSPIPNVISLLEDHGIKVVEIESSDKFDGMSGVADKMPVIVLSSSYGRDRQRFTALHELAHIAITFDASVSENDKETLCSDFASEVLLPQRVFLNYVRRSKPLLTVGKLKTIQKEYGISPDALMYRSKELHIISEQQYRLYFIKKNADAGFKKIMNEASGERETSTRFETLVYSSYAMGTISLSLASSLLNKPIEDIIKEVENVY